MTTVLARSTEPLTARVDEEIVMLDARQSAYFGLNPVAAAVWDLLDELHRTKGVTDATYARALAELGEAGVVEIAGTAGYYTTLAMIMKTARTPAPGGPFLPPRRAATQDGR